MIELSTKINHGAFELREKLTRNEKYVQNRERRNFKDTFKQNQIVKVHAERNNLITATSWHVFCDLRDEASLR